MPVAIDPVGQRKNQPAAAQQIETFQFHREIIVCGDDALANTIIDELRGAGARIIRITSAADLLGAGVHRARAVVCAGPNDAVNLEIALVGKAIQSECSRGGASGRQRAARRGRRRQRPRRDLERRRPRGAVRCRGGLSRNAHQFDTAGIEFVVWGSEAPKGRDAARDL